MDSCTSKQSSGAATAPRRMIAKRDRRAEASDRGEKTFDVHPAIPLRLLFSFFYSLFLSPKFPPRPGVGVRRITIMNSRYQSSVRNTVDDRRNRAKTIIYTRPPLSPLPRPPISSRYRIIRHGHTHAEFRRNDTFSSLPPLSLFRTYTPSSLAGARMCDFTVWWREGRLVR